MKTTFSEHVIGLSIIAVILIVFSLTFTVMVLLGIIPAIGAQEGSFILLLPALFFAGLGFGLIYLKNWARIILIIICVILCANRLFLLFSIFSVGFEEPMSLAVIIDSFLNLFVPAAIVFYLTRPIISKRFLKK